MTSKKLIVNADDFGQSAGINKGIIRAYELGIVTSTSLMVRYPTVNDAVEYCKKNPGLGLGLHVDLGEWMYVDGDWISLYEVVSTEDLNATSAELMRQLNSFINIVGRKPTHIDSHQHIHQRENLRPLFIELAKKLDVTLRGNSGKVNYCGDFYGQNTDGSALHSAISAEGLHKIILSLPDGITELACHPGLDNDIETMYRLEREMEVKTLCDKSIADRISNMKISLCSFEGITF